MEKKKQTDHSKEKMPQLRSAAKALKETTSPKTKPSNRIGAGDAEQRLRESEKRYRTLFESIDEGFCVIEMLFDAGGKPVDYRFLEVNPAFEKHTGLRQAAGRTIRELVPDHDAHWFEIYGHVALTGEPVRFENPAAAMKRWFDVYAFRVDGPESRKVAVLFTDVTERKRAEAMLRQQADELEKANRLKDEFLATLSHELRTPLNAILGWASLLRERKRDEETVDRALETIERNAKAQNKLIEDILDVSRIITGKVRLEMERVKFMTVILAAVDALSLAAEAKGVDLVLNLDPSAETLLGDHDRLKQVVWNLLSNAIKFSLPGGRVEVSLRRNGAMFELQVRDGGKGIDPEFLPFVFDRFRQADSSSHRSHGGLGIGLSIVRHLVELHGGSVWAASPGKDQGATFTVALPIHGAHRAPGRQDDPPAAFFPATESTKALPALENVEVLVVEDERDARDLIRTALEEAGAAVRTATSVEEALALFAGLTPDVIVSDIGMPGKDGYALIREVRAMEGAGGKQVPAVALTAYARPEDRTRALSEGYQTHLSKPIAPDALIRAVAALAGRRDPSRQPPGLPPFKTDGNPE